MYDILEIEVVVQRELMNRLLSLHAPLYLKTVVHFNAYAKARHEVRSGHWVLTSGVLPGTLSF